jgi:hypothetical protein
MAVPGNWTLFYDWDCDGTYSATSMSVESDGTFTIGEGASGLWVQGAGMFVFTFNDLETTYAGNLASKSVTGVSTTFSGLQGCFYMLQEGVLSTFRAERAVGKADARGKS